MLEGLLFLSVPTVSILFVRSARSNAARWLILTWSILPLYEGLGFLTFWALGCEVDWVKGNLCSQAAYVGFAFASTAMSVGATMLLVLPTALLAVLLELRARRLGG